ncbi:uncharacterized protein Dwil_GK10211, partial [Drosophila willistoni]
MLAGGGIKVLLQAAKFIEQRDKNHQPSPPQSSLILPQQQQLQHNNSNNTTIWIMTSSSASSSTTASSSSPSPPIINNSATTISCINGQLEAVISSSRHSEGRNAIISAQSQQISGLIIGNAVDAHMSYVGGIRGGQGGGGGGAATLTPSTFNGASYRQLINGQSQGATTASASASSSLSSIVVASGAAAISNVSSSAPVTGSQLAAAAGAGGRRRTISSNSNGAGTREVHNKLEKNRRAHLKECYDKLKNELLLKDEDRKKISNLVILEKAYKIVKQLDRHEREQDVELERQAKKKIELQKRLNSLKRDTTDQSIPINDKDVNEAVCLATTSTAVAGVAVVRPILFDGTTSPIICGATGLATAGPTTTAAMS